VSASADPRDCPYVGLAPFEATHAEYFFGRTRESKIIADHIISRPVTVLYGPSGIGKSSILNVGLPLALKQISDIRRAALARRKREATQAISDAFTEWVVVPLQDWHDPERLEELAVKELVDRLGDQKPRYLRRFASITSRIARPKGRPVLLILDQFEEYFLYRDKQRMRDLEDAFGRLVLRSDLQFHLLIAIREDALHQLDQLRAFVPSILDSTIQLGPLTDDAVKDAIRGPIARYNEVYRQADRPVVVEDGLVAALIGQLKRAHSEGLVRPGEPEGRIELPYLQIALTKLWFAEGGSQATALREATLTDERQLGGVNRIVRDHVKSVMDRLNGDEQRLCAKMFDRLVTSIGTKIAYPTEALAAADVVGAGVSQPHIEAILKKLTPQEARILKPVRTNGRDGFEIFHDVLGLSVLDWKRDYELSQAEAKRKVELIEIEQRAIRATEIEQQALAAQVRREHEDHRLDRKMRPFVFGFAIGVFITLALAFVRIY
jgi:hypothetical protein